MFLRRILSRSTTGYVDVTSVARSKFVTRPFSTNFSNLKPASPLPDLKTFRNTPLYINGEFVESKTEQWIPVYNPVIIN